MTLGEALLIPYTLFFIGILGIVIRRNLLIILMAMELMLNAAGFSLVVYHAVHPSSGISIVLLFLGLAAAEVAIGLALTINLVRIKRTPDVDLASMLRG